MLCSSVSLRSDLWKIGMYLNIGFINKKTAWGKVWKIAIQVAERIDDAPLFTPILSEMKQYIYPTQQSTGHLFQLCSAI